MAKPTVLYVEDNEAVLKTVSEELEEEGYAVIPARSARELEEKLGDAAPDVILLDLMLPDGNGLDLIKIIRARTDVPVIVVSGKSEMVDKIVGLEMGADDYVGKPAQPREIAARIRAQMRRYAALKSDGTGEKNKKEAGRLRFGPWVLDRYQYQACDGDGKSAGLTVREFQLLEVLVLDSNRVLSRAQLLDGIQRDNHDVTDRAIDVQVMRIRKKLGDRPGPQEIIRAIRGVGYMLSAETEAL